MTSTAQADFEVSGGGSLYILTPLNSDARQHLEENISEESQWWAGGVAVEWRYIQPLVENLRAEGYVVR
jgi:hypothetical protein